MASGRWLSPQVWAAGVASGWAGLCLKEGEGRKECQDVKLLARDPKVSGGPIT